MNTEQVIKKFEYLVAGVPESNIFFGCTKSELWEAALSALRAQQERMDPQPLTEAQLKEMAENPFKHWVWIENLSKPELSAYFQNHSDYTEGIAFCCGYLGTGWHFKYCEYGETWLAYDHQPGEGRV